MESVGNQEQQNVSFNMTFLASPVTIQNNLAENVENTQQAGNCQRSISEENMRNILPPNELVNVENVTCSPGTSGSQNTQRQAPAESQGFVENVSKSPERRSMLRTTSTGGIRNTPQRQAQKRNNAGRKKSLWW